MTLSKRILCRFFNWSYMTSIDHTAFMASDTISG